MILFIRRARMGKFMEIENGLVIANNLGREVWEVIV